VSKRNWVCFDCRSVVRREESPRLKSVVCAMCRRPRVNLGYKIPIPQKSRVKDWESLRTQHLSEERADEQQRQRERQRLKHWLEQEIVRLESRPLNQGRAKAVRLLRKELRDLW